ncbi:MAG: mechanosensitive ion channel [Muribaculaceae bacterium]|nr:mechanosensitive ion channel [Muribaculaceae bacterium]
MTPISIFSTLIPGLNNAFTPEQTDTTNFSFDALKSISISDITTDIASKIVHFVISLAIAVLVFYVGKWIISKLYKLTHNILIRQNVEPSLSTFILSLIRILLYFILIVTVIGIIGIETSSFLALFASAGVAIGMALSGTLQNFAGGVMILLLKPYKVGDYIEVGTYAGTVTEIQIFHTIINTGDNKSIIIPNGGLSTGSVNNWSKEEYRRIEWSIAISYGDDVETARNAILEIINSYDRVIKEHDNPERKAVVRVLELADSCVKLIARAWGPTTDYWELYFEINEKIYKQLPLSGITFPFPQLDVHISK